MGGIYMFNSFKIKIGGSKSDCCSITIQEVQEKQEDAEETKDCCEIKVEKTQSCCN
jgi:hypothetical protein